MEKCTILIADRDIHARMQIINCMKKLVDDVKYIEALDCRATLQHVIRDKPDLILMDLELSVKEGLETLRKIKKCANEKIRNIPIFIFSKIKDASIVKQVVILGVAGYIVKPSSDDDIASRIVNVINKDETKIIIEKVIKPQLNKLFGSIIVDELISNATVFGMKGDSDNEKIKLIIESICSDQRCIGMLGTQGVRKQRDEWSHLLK